MSLSETLDHFKNLVNIFEKNYDNCVNLRKKTYFRLCRKDALNISKCCCILRKLLLDEYKKNPIGKANNLIKEDVKDNEVDDNKEEEEDNEEQNEKVEKSIKLKKKSKNKQKKNKK